MKQQNVDNKLNSFNQQWQIYDYVSEFEDFTKGKKSKSEINNKAFANFLNKIKRYFNKKFSHRLSDFQNDFTGNEIYLLEQTQLIQYLKEAPPYMVIANTNKSFWIKQNPSETEQNKIDFNKFVKAFEAENANYPTVFGLQYKPPFRMRFGNINFYLPKNHKPFIDFLNSEQPKTLAELEQAEIDFLRLNKNPSEMKQAVAKNPKQKEMILTFLEMVKADFHQPFTWDRRIKADYYVAEYRGDDNEIYRKTYWIDGNKNFPEVVKVGSHKDINDKLIQITGYKKNPSKNPLSVARCKQFLERQEDNEKPTISYHWKENGITGYSQRWKVTNYDDKNHNFIIKTFVENKANSLEKAKLSFKTFTGLNPVNFKFELIESNNVKENEMNNIKTTTIKGFVFTFNPRNDEYQIHKDSKHIASGFYSDVSVYSFFERYIGQDLTSSEIKKVRDLNKTKNPTQNSIYGLRTYNLQSLMNLVYSKKTIKSHLFSDAEMAYVKGYPKYFNYGYDSVSLTSLGKQKVLSDRQNGILTDAKKLAIKTAKTVKRKVHQLTAENPNLVKGDEFWVVWKDRNNKEYYLTVIANSYAEAETIAVRQIKGKGKIDHINNVTTLNKNWNDTASNPNFVFSGDKTTKVSGGIDFRLDVGNNSMLNALNNLDAKKGNIAEITFKGKIFHWVKTNNNTWSKLIETENPQTAENPSLSPADYKDVVRLLKNKATNHGFTLTAYNNGIQLKRKSEILHIWEAYTNYSALYSSVNSYLDFYKSNPQKQNANVNNSKNELANGWYKETAYGLTLWKFARDGQLVGIVEPSSNRMFRATNKFGSAIKPTLANAKAFVESFQNPQKQNAPSELMIYENHIDEKLNMLSASFQGNISGAIKKMPNSTKYMPSKQARLGKLKSIELKNGDLLSFGDATLSADIRNNLYITGKDAIFKALKLPKQNPTNTTSLIDLGAISEVRYITRKNHIENGQLVEYYHKAGEVTGELPHLFVSNPDKQLYIFGGNYDIWSTGIVN